MKLMIQTNIQKFTPPGYDESELSHVWLLPFFSFLLLCLTFSFLVLSLAKTLNRISMFERSGMNLCLLEMVEIYGTMYQMTFMIFVITLIIAIVTCENPPKLNPLPGSLVMNFSSADEELEE